MKKTKAKETAAGAELRRRAGMYKADAVRVKVKDPGLAVHHEGRAEGLLDAAIYVDELLARRKLGEEDLGDVSELAQSLREGTRLDELERRVAALEHAPRHFTPEAIAAFQAAWNADPVHKKPLPPSMAAGGLLSDKPARAKALRPSDSRPTLTNGAPPPEEDDDPDVAPEGEASDYDLALLLALGKGGRLTAAQAALLAGFSPMSGALAKGMRRLRRGGLVAPAGDGRYRPTHRGETIRQAASPGRLRTSEGLLPYWAAKLGEHKGTFLSIFAAASPKSVSHEELAQKSGFSKTSGAFPKALRRLRRMHLLEEMRLSAEFVEILELKP